MSLFKSAFRRFENGAFVSAFQENRSALPCRRSRSAYMRFRMKMKL